jgi:hypothetical protein
MVIRRCIMVLKRGSFLALCFGQFACNPIFPNQSSKESTIPTTQRIVELSKLIEKQTTLPSPIKDSHCIEEKVGDGNLGPSDFFTYCAISVALSDIPAWRKKLSPLQPPNIPARYAVPRKTVSWWPSVTEFKLFEPSLITGRANGWTGISPQAGKVYVFGFTN